MPAGESMKIAAADTNPAYANKRLATRNAGRGDLALYQLAGCL
jgi:hypothetical protein